ncbi:MAG: hypothetical protein AB8G86_04755 [Saprospiraceae bacterium]
MKNGIDLLKNSLNNAENAYLLDIDLLPFVEKAENGCFDSQVHLLEAFTFGYGVKKNKALEEKYGKMVYENTDDDSVKLAILWNLANRAYDYGNYEEMEIRFNEVIKFMQNNIPMDEWTFELFELMKERLEEKTKQ